MMFLLNLIAVLVSLQNQENVDSFGGNFMSSPFSMSPRHCTMDGDLTCCTGFMDQRVTLPNATLSSAEELTTELLQTNITESIDETLEQCTVDTYNMTSHDEFMDWMVIEPNVILSALEPSPDDLLSQTNITYGGADEGLQCTAADNITLHTEFMDEMSMKPTAVLAQTGFLDGMNMEPSDAVPTAVVQTVVIIGAAFKDVELLNSAALLDSVYYAVILGMLSVYLYKRMRMPCLHREILDIIKEGKAVTDQMMAGMERDLDGQSGHFTRSTFNNAKLNRKIDSVSKDLNGEQNDLERMQDDLNYWKQKWLAQSHKIRQINPDNIKQQTEQSSSKVDKFIEEQRKEIRDAACYFGEKFYEMDKFLAERHCEIFAMLTDLDAIHDWMDGQSASQF